MSANSSRRRAAVCVAALIVPAGLAQGQGAPPAAATPQPVELPGYRMQPKDTVTVKVFQEDDLNTTARIDRDGNIFFPLLGKAHISGETVQEATTTMETLLRKYLINPQVYVEITTYTKEHFTILGQVNKPGIFDIPDEGSLTLLEALGMAGGYTKIANPSHIKIKRMENGKEVLYQVDGNKLLDKKYASQPVFQILPGDTIDISESLF
jgi:protein involved in polysaccharide export with SLBB domain